MDAPQNKLFSSIGNLQLTLVAGLDLLDGWPLYEFLPGIFFRSSILNEDGEKIISFCTDDEPYSGSGEFDLFHQMYLFEGIRSTFSLEVAIFAYRAWPVLASGQQPRNEVKVGQLLIPLSRLSVGTSVTSWHQVISKAKECSKAALKLDLKYIQEGLVVHDATRVAAPTTGGSTTRARGNTIDSRSESPILAIPSSSTTASASATPEDPFQVRVLVAEANVTAQNSLAKILMAKGYVVDVVSNGKEAYDLLASCNPCTYDAVTLDIRMPVMDGFEAVKLCREHAHLKKVPFFATCADVASGLRRGQALSAGFNSFLGKPIMPQEIDDLLCQYLTPSKINSGKSLSRADFLSSRDDRDIAIRINSNKSPKSNDDPSDISVIAATPQSALKNDAPVPDFSVGTSFDNSNGSRILPVGIVDYALLVGPNEIPSEHFVDSYKTFEDHSDISIKIFDRFPKDNHACSPLPDNVERFACPNGSRFASVDVTSSQEIALCRPALEYFSFVMSGDEEQYVSCIKFFILVDIRPIFSDDKNKSLKKNWWLEVDEKIVPVSTDSVNEWQLHYAEITLCLIIHGGPFVSQLFQCLSYFYTKDILPVLSSWEHKSFGIFPTQMKVQSFYIPSFDCIPGLAALCLTSPAPIPGALHIALTLESGTPDVSSYVDSPHIICPSRLVKPGLTDDNDVVFSIPDPTSLPISPHPIEVMFQYMGPRGAIDLLSCALCEKKILLHSFDIDKLPVIGEGIRALLYPLKWTHVYVPVVPMDLLNLVEAPVPFIIGVNSRLLLEDERNGGLSEEFLRNHDVVLADCDSGVVSQAGGWGVTLTVGKYLSQKSSKSGNRVNMVDKESASLPPSADRWLLLATERILKDNKFRSGSFGPWGCTSTALQVIVFDVLAMYLHRISDCLFFLDVNTPVFNRPLFLSEYTLKDNRPFMASLTDTNAFHLLTASMNSSTSQTFFKDVIKSLCSEYQSENLSFAQPTRDFMALFPEWLLNDATISAPNVESFIEQALRNRFSRYYQSDTVRNASHVYDYKEEYLLLDGIKDLPVFKLPLEHKQSLNTRENMVGVDDGTSFSISFKHDSFSLEDDYDYVSSIDVLEMLPSRDGITVESLNNSIFESYPHNISGDLCRFRGCSVLPTMERISSPTTRMNSMTPHLNPDVYRDIECVEDANLPERSQEAYDKMVDTIGRFLQYVFSSPKLEIRILKELSSSLDLEMKYLSSRRKFLDMLSQAHPSSSDKRLFPLRSTAFDALVEVFISFLNDCQMFKDFLSAQKLIGFAETFVRVEIQKVDESDGNSSDDELHAETMHGTLNALIEGNAPIESICDKIKHHRIFHNLDLWKVVLRSVEIMYKSGHTAKFNSTTGNTVMVKLCRSVLVMMLSLEVNLDRAMAFIQLVSSDWKLEMISYFDLQRYTSNLWKDTGECEKMLALYKKFGIQLMARLTDVVLGTAVEIIPGAENKSRIMRILDLDNITAPEDLEHMVPRTQSVLEVSISDVIYHITNKSISTNVGASKRSSRSRLEVGDNCESPTNVLFAQGDSVTLTPFASASIKTDDLLGSKAAPESNFFQKMKSRATDENESQEDDAFNFSDDGKEAMVPNGGSSSRGESPADDSTSSQQVYTPMTFKLDLNDTSTSGTTKYVTPSADATLFSSISTNGDPIYEELVVTSMIGSTVYVNCVASLGNLALFGMDDGNFNIINMESGRTCLLPTVKVPTKTDSISRIVAIPSTCTISTSHYAGVSFAGDILYNESSGNNHVQFSGQGLLYASQDGSIHGIAVPEDPFKDIAVVAYEGRDSASRSVSSRDVISAFRSYSSENVREGFSKENTLPVESWRIADHPGNQAEVRSILVSLSTTAMYSYQPEPEMPHIFSAESSWQISSGDMKGHVTVHRGTGALLAPMSLNSRRGSVKSAAPGYSQPQVDGFESATVQSQSTQLVGVGGIACMCSVACVQRQRGPVGSVENLSCLSERLCIGSYKGHIIVIDVGSGQPMFRVKGHTPSGICAVTTLRSNEFISAGFDGAVKLWDLRSTSSTSSLRLGRAAVTCLHIGGTDDNNIYTGSANGEVNMWDLRYDTVNPAMVVNGHADRITALTLHGAEKTLITASLDGSIRLWDSDRNYESVQVLRAFKNGDGVASISLSSSPYSHLSSPTARSIRESSKGASTSSWLVARSSKGAVKLWKNIS